MEVGPPRRRQWFSEHIRELFLEHLPAAHQDDNESNKHGVETSTWLMTLATGLTALLLSDPDPLRRRAPVYGKVLLVCLVISVAGGILFRIVVMSAGVMRRAQIRSVLLGLSSIGRSSLDPWEPEMLPTLEAIDQEYRELVGEGLPENVRAAGIDAARSYYTVAYTVAREREKDSMEKLSSLLGAMAGMSETESPTLFEPSSERNQGTRSRAKWLLRLTALANWLFRVQLLALLVGIGAAVWILW